MLLTISTTHQPATDLGFLLYKHPEKIQEFELSFGKAHVFYPESSIETCTAALLLELDPVSLSRRERGSSNFALQPYVNDRPYVASSFLSVAIAKVFGTAMQEKPRADQSPERQALKILELPLTLKLTSLPCRGGEDLLRKLFEPLGYTVAAERYALDETFPAWGESRYYTVTLTATKKLYEALRHLYVLIPVLDDDKHYWVGEDEVEHLLRRGEGWLSEHPEKELIVKRYLKHQRGLTRQALETLEDATEEEEDETLEEAAEQKIGLHTQRLTKVVEVLKQSGAKRVLDLGCGEGKLIRKLLDEKQFAEVVGMDVSQRALEIAKDRLERLPAKVRERLTLFQSSLLYRDKRLQGFDAAALVEVIEHLDEFRLASFERTVFEFARPKLVVITTPNREYNVVWESLPAGKMRHGDHRFEWTRSEFQTWASSIAERFGYTVELSGIGDEVENLGTPTQMGVFHAH
ncbi:MAG: 3' terminal RNA ribose 2'-O-methyltransferase Hen1 [Trueperaceae bacterium]